MAVRIRRDPKSDDHHHPILPRLHISSCRPYRIMRHCVRAETLSTRRTGLGLQLLRSFALKFARVPPIGQLPLFSALVSLDWRYGGIPLRKSVAYGPPNQFLPCGYP